MLTAIAEHCQHISVHVFEGNSPGARESKAEVLAGRDERTR